MIKINKNNNNSNSNNNGDIKAEHGGAREAKQRKRVTDREES